MIRLLVIYLLLGGIALTFWHSYRVITRGKLANVEVNAILEARREKGILSFSLGISFLYALSVLFAAIFFEGFSPWVVLTPAIYLLLWSLLRLLVRAR